MELAGMLANNPGKVKYNFCLMEEKYTFLDRCQR